MFFNHPKNVCLTYYSHLRFSLKNSFKLAIASFKAFIHAIYPDIFITSTHDAIEDVYNDLQTIGCR